MNKIAILRELLLLFLPFTNFVYAQNQNFFGIGGGVSKFYGYASEEWNVGFNVNGEWFNKISENVLIGSRFSYTRCTPNLKEIRNNTSIQF